MARGKKKSGKRGARVTIRKRGRGVTLNVQPAAKPAATTGSGMKRRRTYRKKKRGRGAFGSTLGSIIPV